MDIKIHVPGEKGCYLRRTDRESLLRDDAAGGSRYAGERKGDAAGNAWSTGVDMRCVGSRCKSREAHVDCDGRLVIAEDDTAVSRCG